MSGEKEQLHDLIHNDTDEVGTIKGTTIVSRIKFVKRGDPEYGSAYACELRRHEIMVNGKPQRLIGIIK
jgi:hypothetical protein